MRFCQVERPTMSSCRLGPKCSGILPIFLFIYYFFLLSQKGRNEKRDSFYTAKRASSVFTVVVTKHVWPYFQSRFPKTSSERVSSWGRPLKSSAALKSKEKTVEPRILVSPQRTTNHHGGTGHHRRRPTWHPPPPPGRSHHLPPIGHRGRFRRRAVHVLPTLVRVPPPP